MSGNEITPFGGETPATMSSREIAELTGKEHKHVIRDIRAMLEALKDGPDLGHVRETKDTRGYTAEIHLDRDLTLTLVSGYDIVLRNRIVKRLAEYDAASVTGGFRIPQTMAEALRLAADQTDRADKAEAALVDAQPKVAFAQQVEAAPDAIDLGKAAKILGTGRNRLSSKLKELGWLTRFGEPYQDKINQGLLDVKIGQWEHPNKGLQRSVTALVTGKGLSKLHTLIGTTH